MKISSPWIPHYQSPKMLYTSLEEFAIERPPYFKIFEFFLQFSKGIAQNAFRDPFHISNFSGRRTLNGEFPTLFCFYQPQKFETNKFNADIGGSIISCLKFKRILIKLIQKYVPWVSVTAKRLLNTPKVIYKDIDVFFWR